MGIASNKAIPALNVEDLGPVTQFSLCSPRKRWEYRNQNDTSEGWKDETQKELD